jgi:hypothetical protein
MKFLFKSKNENFGEKESHRGGMRIFPKTQVGMNPTQFKQNALMPHKRDKQSTHRQALK